MIGPLAVAARVALNSDSRIRELPLKHIGDCARLATCCRGNSLASYPLSFLQHCKKSSSRVSINLKIKSSLSVISVKRDVEQDLFSVETRENEKEKWLLSLTEEKCREREGTVLNEKDETQTRG